MVEETIRARKTGSLRRSLADLSDERYDVALSLHGKDALTLDIADAVTECLQRHGLSVFHYRTDEQDRASFGQAIIPRLERVYGKVARQVVVVGSPGYGREGLTVHEWDIIKRRAEADPEQLFLSVIGTTAGPTLPADLQGRVFMEITDPGGAGGSLHRQVQPVVETVLARLGRWHGIKGPISSFVLAAASAAVLALWYSRTYVEPLPKAACSLATALAFAWYLAFRLIPRYFPSLIYGPRSLPAKLYRNFYLNRYAERLAFGSVIAVCALASATLPSKDIQVQRATAAWLGNPGPEREAAQRFFKDRLGRPESLRVWFGILADREGHGPADRGKALDLVSKLLATEATSSAVKDVSGLLRNFGDRGELGLTPDTWQRATSEIDVRGLRLEANDFSRLSFTGRDTRLDGATLRQSRFPASFFQATQCDRADFAGCDFSLASFLGIRGGADFSQAQAPGATFFGCDLKGSRFYGADLTGVKFLSCKLSEVDFSNAYMTGVTFEDCDLQGTTFTGNDVRWGGRWGILAGTSFIRCRLGTVFIRGADLRGQQLQFVQARVKDPSDLDRTKDVVTRDIQTRSVAHRDRVADFSVPPAMILGCDFIDDCDLAGVRADGLRIDKASYDSLGDGCKKQLKSGGLDPAALLIPRSSNWELKQRYPALTEDSWDNISALLGQLFEAARIQNESNN